MAHGREEFEEQWRERLDQEAANAQGISLSAYRIKKEHEEKMRIGRMYFEEDKLRQEYINYYVENKE